LIFGIEKCPHLTYFDTLKITENVLKTKVMWKQLIGISTGYTEWEGQEKTDRFWSVLPPFRKKTIRSIGDYWYDKPYKRKKREIKTALNEYQMKSDEESKNKYCNCRREYVNLLKNKKQRWQAMESEQINYMSKHRYTRNIWTTLRKPNI
jgi:hypothetical protein